MIPLTVEHLRYRWPNGSSALERCSFSIPGPGLWMLVGGNGSGKSTLSVSYTHLTLPTKVYV